MRYAEASGHLSEGGYVRKSPLSNSMLGVVIFILTEVMFFLGLISAFLITKANAVIWPPIDQPRLPVGITAANTAVLLASGIAMFLAARAFSKESFSGKARALFLASIGMGVFFVVFQGYEWARLLNFGLTMQSGAYGAFFYLIIGTHALHAVGSLLAQGRLFWLFQTRRLKVDGLYAGAAFWYFVVAVWPILYFLVYLS